MPTNMTPAEIQSALDEMELLRPPIGFVGDKGGSYSPVSYNLAASSDAILLRVVDKNGEIKDIRLTQALSVSLVGELAKAIHVVDWMDSAGHIVPNPPAP